MTPVILVTADVRRMHRFVWHAAIDAYLKAVTGIGAVPLLLPSLGDRIDVDAALGRVDGVLVTGSRTNVHPERYGVASSPRHRPYDEARDGTVLPLIRRTLARGVPLLAICRGMQELNVALGGTLLTEAQERPGSLDHRSPAGDGNDVRFRVAHDIAFEPDSQLARLIGATTFKVNSLHRQVIDRVAPGLVVEARAPDGTVEAVRVADATGFAFGVQWHPEYWAASDAPSGAIFKAFGDAVRGRMAHAYDTAAE